MDLPSIDFSQLELREIGSWPRPLRIGLIVAAGLIGIALMYFILLKSQIEELELVQIQQEEKRKEFKDKYSKAVNLDAYKQQMLQIQDAYKIMLKQLPDSSHVPELIDSISRIATNNNLKFESIKPGDPKSVLGFYKELPIDIKVIGTYHSFGKFVSDISKLSRIVTLHDFTIKADKGQGGNLLSMQITAKTYWLSEDTETKQDPAASKTSGSKARGKAGQPGRPVPGAPNPTQPGSRNGLPGGSDSPGSASPLVPKNPPGTEEL